MRAEIVTRCNTLILQVDLRNIIAMMRIAVSRYSGATWRFKARERERERRVIQTKSDEKKKKKIQKKKDE